METSQHDYRKGELGKVDTSGERIRAKFRGDDGESFWLSITPTEFEQIKVVLLDWRNR